MKRRKRNIRPTKANSPTVLRKSNHNSSGLEEDKDAAGSRVCSEGGTYELMPESEADAGVVWEDRKKLLVPPACASKGKMALPVLSSLCPGGIGRADGWSFHLNNPLCAGRRRQSLKFPMTMMSFPPPRTAEYLILRMKIQKVHRIWDS